MYDLIIIGAGPAGLTAGIYAGRYRLNALILESLSVGGQIILSPSIENYPGFPKGILTSVLIDQFKEQVDELNIPILPEEVIEINLDNQLPTPVYTVVSSENSYKARAIIIATGASPKRMGVLGEEKFIGKGISYCATCDAPFFKNKEILVVGGEIGL